MPNTLYLVKGLLMGRAEVIGMNLLLLYDGKVTLSICLLNIHISNRRRVLPVLSIGQFLFVAGHS